ncbi:MAG: methionyl-tRNA formyltransferase [Acidobacteriota bacterium]
MTLILPGRVVFMGTPDFARVHLQALADAGLHPLAVFTQPDKSVGRKRLLTPPPVKLLAAELGMEVHQPASLKGAGVQGLLRDLEPDVIVVVAYGKILPEAVLAIPRLGCVNVHASLLPRHRGASPIAHAIWAGDTETGVCTMRMDKGLDTGPVYLEGRIPIPPSATAGGLSLALARLGSGLLIETLEGLHAGTLEARPQDEALATYAPRLTSEDGRLEFSRPAAELERQVRAFDPWPGTFFEYREERIKVLAAAVGPTSTQAQPGEVVAGGAFGVACGDGRVLLVGKMQRPGKRPMTSEEVLRGYAIPPGTRF